ncbi:SDR family oxidoreductase [Teichococcus oryzae]|uniref:SDR family oxidoreductase n=1 Tax=Teichococcus oryzae TaxID=1608942 RepID=UPI002795CA91|nr:SDR family oxidoreductase [Pseudoroseomonas oryzae]
MLYGGKLGQKDIRVHAISSDPFATRAASGFDGLTTKAPSRALVRRLVTIEEVGAACVFLASDYAVAMTGKALYVGGRYHILDQVNANLDRESLT